jgi:uncharacterized protein (TIGR00290 family)
MDLELTISDLPIQRGCPARVGVSSGHGDLLRPTGEGMKEKAIVSWSGGKDSALALLEAQQDFEIVALLTTVTEGYDRISVHGVRTTLLERQADSLKCALDKVVISRTCSNEEYEAKMRVGLDKYRRAGARSVVCGDIFLEDVRRYREERLFTAGLKGVFPLWGRDTTELAHRFVGLGFRAVLCCVDTTALDAGFAGRPYDRETLAQLPPSVDPCGENGEFHSFVFDGPNMASRVECRVGERVLRDNRFCYCDLLPEEA